MKIGNRLKIMRNHLLFWASKWRTWIQLLGIPFILVAAWVIWKTNGENYQWNQLDTWWVRWGDPLLGVGTFLVAFVIWLTNMAKDWEDRLPKLLSITYKLDNRDVIICKNATLAHEGDIRNWGQQLGQQTIGRSLRFNLLQKFDIGKPIIRKSNQEGTKGTKYHKHYTATFYLKNNSGVKELDVGKFVFDMNNPNESKKSNYIGPVVEVEPTPKRTVFSVEFKENYGILKFSLDGSISPKDLIELIPDYAQSSLFSGKGIILSGKGPIWLYGYLVHYYHATKWVATYDPRLSGAVVVESHVSDVNVGDIITLD